MFNILIDSHAHLDDEAFSEDIDEVLNNIRDAGILVINAGSDLDTSQTSVILANKNDFIYACVGVHPHEVQKTPKKYLEILEQLTSMPKVVAIGEIGLDYYYDLSDREIQKKAFAEQLNLAKRLDLPVVVHDREAHQDTFDILKSSGIKRGLLHCYSGSLEMAKEFMKLGFYFSFGGTITFKNAKKPKEVAKELPLDRILLETDCPYLSPVPYRGKRNDPTKVKIIAEALANLKGISPQEVEKVTYKNTVELFRL